MIGNIVWIKCSSVIVNFKMPLLQLDPSRSHEPSGTIIYFH